MSEFSDYLPQEKRRAVILQRISRFAEEGYQYELNKKFAVASGDFESVEKADIAIHDLSLAITLHEEELRSL